MRRWTIALLLALASQMWAYVALQAEAGTGDRLNTAYTLAVNHGITLPDGSCAEPDRAVGVSMGHCRGQPWGACWMSNPSELHITESWGLRREVRVGIGYYAAPERAMMYAEAQGAIYWRYIQIGVSISTMSYYQHGIRAPVSVRLVFSVVKAI